MKPWIKDILDWYIKNKRVLPWRENSKPYCIWISEIMLQQTRVEAVIGYYNRFLNAFPDVFALAEADIEQVLKLWEGLGYYSRARNLHKAANVIVEQYGGIFPDTYDELIGLPGIGPYTVGAILGIAFNEPYPAIDGNVLRVMSRVLLIEEAIQEKKVQKRIFDVLIHDFPHGRAADFNQSLMELGAMICIPKSPRCMLCPIQKYCNAFKEGVQNELPVQKQKPEKKLVYRHIAVIEKENKVLMCKRKEGVLKGLWEFPGVDVEKEMNFAKEFEKQYGIAITEGKHFVDARHVFTHIIWEMKAFLCTVDEEIPFDENFKWINKDELDEITIPTAFKKIKNKIK